MIAAGEGAGGVKGRGPQSVLPSEVYFNTPNEDHFAAGESDTGLVTVEGPPRTFGEMIASPFRSIGRVLFRRLVYGHVPGIIAKPAAYEAFRDMKSLGGAEIYYNVVADYKSGQRMKGIVLAGRADDLASFLSVLIENPVKFPPAIIASNIRQGYASLKIYEDVIARVTPYVGAISPNPATGLYEVIIEPQDGTFLEMLQRFNNAKRAFEAKDKYELEVQLSNSPDVDTVIGALDGLLNRTGMWRGGRFRKLLKYEGGIWNPEDGLVRTNLFAARGISADRAHVGILVDRGGNPAAFVFRVVREFENRWQKAMQLWIGVPSRDGKRIFWETQTFGPVDSENMRGVFALLKRDIFKPTIYHLRVPAWTAFAARDLDTLNLGIEPNVRARGSLSAGLDVTGTVGNPLTVGNVSRILRELLQIIGANAILQTLKISVPDDIKTEDIAGWQRAIHERPSGMIAFRHVNDGVATGSPFLVTAVEAGVRIKKGTGPSIVLVFHQGDKMVSKWIGSILPGSGFLWTIEDSSPETMQNADWTSKLSEALRKFVFAVFKDGIAHVNAADLKTTGNGSGGSSETQPGGGAITAAADGAITAAADGAITAASEPKAEEVGGQTAEYSVGCDDINAFETSFGIFTGELAFEPLPI